MRQVKPQSFGATRLRRRCQCVNCSEHVWLTPGFIDIQVNGGGDVLFNDAPTADTIRKMIAAHRRFGTTALFTDADQ